MKKISFIVLAAMLMASCSSVKLPAPYSVVDFIDYSLLTSKGIFATESNSVSFDYEPLGSVMVVEYGGWGRMERKNSVRDDTYSGVSGKNVYIEPALSDAFDDLASKLQELGANGIINFQITYKTRDLASYVPGSIVLSGMAIKR